MSGGTATALDEIVCLDDTTECTAAEASTYGDPAGTAVHHVANGLQEAAITTVSQATTNTTGDTLTFDHVFTASATEDVVGIHVTNTDNDVTFVECCFNALIAMESSDTLTIDGEIVVDQA